MKILLTGAKGTVGQELTRVLSPENEVLGTDKDTLDITDLTAVESFLKEHQPEMIIHLAAATDVDWCETNSEECLRTNTEATKNLAEASQSSSAVFVFPSSTFVYPGEEGEVYDDRTVEPSLEKVKGVYAKSKLLAEKEIERIFGDSDYFIIRFGQLFGGGIEDKKFVGKILALAREGKTIKAVNDRWIQPTYITDTVKNLVALIKTNHWGSYNMVAHGQASYFEYAKEVVEGKGFTNALVIPISSSEFKESAPRPHNLNCLNGKLQDIGLDLMRDWKVALKEYLETI